MRPGSLYTGDTMRYHRPTTYFLRITMEDGPRQRVKLWASVKAAMEVPLATDPMPWTRLRSNFYRSGIFEPSILDRAEHDLLNEGCARLPHTILLQTHMDALQLLD